MPQSYPSSLTNEQWELLSSLGNDGVPTTFTLNSTGKRIRLIRWTKKWGSKLSPEARCREVSARFQKLEAKGELNYLTSGIMRVQPVVCAVKDYGTPCSQLLFTLRPADNANQVIEHLNGSSSPGHFSLSFSNESRAVEPLRPIQIQRADGSTQNYYSMEEILSAAPVEEEN